jgi:DNA transformation protein and related proteins
MTARSADHEFRDFVLDQLAGLDYLQVKPMFGGYGLYCLKIFFGIIYDGQLFFKTHPETIQAYLDAGSDVFQPAPGKVLKHYYEVPAEILEQPDRLAAAARDAAQWHGRDPH